MTQISLTGRWGARQSTTDGPDPSALAGRRFALAADRKLDLFGRLLTARGAGLERYPLWSHLPLCSDRRAQAWVEAIIDGGVQDVVWSCAEGVRSATQVAASLGKDWALVRAMHRCRHFASCRLTSVALHRLGVRQVHLATSRREAGPLLLRHSVCRRRVAVQTYGGLDDQGLIDLLRKMRCEVRHAGLHQLPTPRETALVDRLLDRLLGSELDGMIVSDLHEMARLFSVAAARRQKRPLREALQRTMLIAMSPRVADELRHVDLHPRLSAKRTFHLLPLLREIEQRVGPRASAQAS